MPDRYELRAVFEVTDAKQLLASARRRHHEYYPPGTEHAPPRPRDVASAIGDALIDCKEGLAPVAFGLSYLQSVSGPIDEKEELALEGVAPALCQNGREWILLGISGEAA